MADFRLSQLFIWPIALDQSKENVFTKLNNFHISSVSASVLGRKGEGPGALYRKRFPWSDMPNLGVGENWQLSMCTCVWLVGEGLETGAVCLCCATVVGFLSLIRETGAVSCVVLQLSGFFPCYVRQVLCACVVLQLSGFFLCYVRQVLCACVVLQLSGFFP